MGCFDRGETPRGRLAFDDEAAWRSGFDHKAGQAQEGRAFPRDRPGAVPCRVDEKNNQPARAGHGAGEAIVAHAHRPVSWIEQDGVVPWIFDQRKKPRIIVKAHSRNDLAVGQVQAREPARRAFLMAELFRVHEEHDSRSRFHWRERWAEAAVLGTPASVASLARQHMAR